jgi:hypothetical protein
MVSTLSNQQLLELTNARCCLPELPKRDEAEAAKDRKVLSDVSEVQQEIPTFDQGTG